MKKQIKGEKSMTIFYKFIYKLVRGLYSTFYNVNIEGEENLPDKTGFIIASNHRSFADPPLVAMCAGLAKYSFVAKEELFRIPVFNWVIRALGAFPVERGRGDMNVIETSTSKLAEGRNLVIFPEGTRHKDGKLGKGKSGVALIAAKSGATVVPTAIIFGEKLRFRSKVTIRYGKPISPEELKLSENPGAHELKNVRNKIMDGIKNALEGK